MKRKTLTALGMASLVSVSCLAFSKAANAYGVSRIETTAFTPDAGLITFSEFANGTSNPVYTPEVYGGGTNSPTVSFAGLFKGQTTNGDFSLPGAAATGVVSGTPIGTLALDSDSPKTFITPDGANPTWPVLSGAPIFNGPISILFSTDVAAVGLDGGYFDAIGGTAITAFARDGSQLGLIRNESKGIEFMGLVTNDGQNRIAGLQFSLVGPEPAGFAIDNLRFAQAGEVNTPVPEPLTILGSLTAVGFGANFLRTRKRIVRKNISK